MQLKDGGGPGDGWAWYDRSYIDASAWPIGLQEGSNTGSFVGKREEVRDPCLGGSSKQPRYGEFEGFPTKSAFVWVGNI